MLYEIWDLRFADDSAINPDTKAPNRKTKI